MRIPEILRKKQQSDVKKSQPVEVPPVEIPRTPEPEVYPNTILGVLTRLKKRLTAIDLSFEEFQNESKEASSKLLEICKEGVEAMQKKCERNGRKWEGKVSFGGFPMEQDGSYWGNTDGVEINSDSLVVFSTGDKTIGEVQEKEKFEVKISPDFTKVFSATYIRVKTFDSENLTIEDTKVEFEDNMIQAISFRKVPLVPNVLGSFYIKPEGLVRELQIRFDVLQPSVSQEQQQYPTSKPLPHGGWSTVWE